MLERTVEKLDLLLTTYQFRLQTVWKSHFQRMEQYVSVAWTHRIAVPSLLIWGDHDRIIPVDHGYAAHERMPGSRLEVFPDAGHFPHRDDPHRFVSVLRDFMASSPGAHLDGEAIRSLMLRDGRTVGQ